MNIFLFVKIFLLFPLFIGNEINDKLQDKIIKLFINNLFNNNFTSFVPFINFINTMTDSIKHFNNIASYLIEKYKIPCHHHKNKKLFIIKIWIENKTTDKFNFLEKKILQNYLIQLNYTYKKIFDVLKKLNNVNIKDLKSTSDLLLLQEIYNLYNTIINFLFISLASLLPNNNKNIINILVKIKFLIFTKEVNDFYYFNFDYNKFCLNELLKLIIILENEQIIKNLLLNNYQIYFKILNLLKVEYPKIIFLKNYYKN